MGVIGVDGIGGDVTNGVVSAQRALDAIALANVPGATYRIALPEAPAAPLPPEINWFVARSLDEVVSQFVKEGLPLVTAVNLQQGMKPILRNKMRDIRRIPLAAEIPLVENRSVLFLDVGGNSDLYDIVDSNIPPSQQYIRKAENVMHFARLGGLYMQLYRNIRRPVVGLLNNGTEETKGTKLVRECNALLHRDAAHGHYAYAGFVEPKHIPQLNVLVTDGYVGNLSLKLIEAALSILAKKPEMVSRSTGALIVGLRNSIILKVHGEATSKDYATAYAKALRFAQPVTFDGTQYPNLSIAITSEYERRYGQKQQPF